MISPETATESSKSDSKAIELRTALAILRGMEFLGRLKSGLGSTVEQDASKRIEYLTNQFLQFHGELFRDWTNQSVSTPRPGYISNPQMRLELRSAISNILFHPENGIFDGNGSVILKEEELPRILAEFYHKIREIQPFEYGTKLTLDFFMVALANLPAFSEVYPNKIDFRRLDRHLKHVINVADDVDALESAFSVALHGRTPALDNRNSDFTVWSKSEMRISEIPFLAQKNSQGKDCLVTIDGGLIELERIKDDLEAWLRSDRQIADFRPISKQEICEYLPGTERLRNGDNYDIDGIEIKNGAAPLFCLGTNILTGLYSTRHNELERLIKRFVNDEADIFRLANNEVLYNRLLEYADAENAPDLRRSIEIAFVRLSAITMKMEEHKVAALEGLTPVENPYVWPCQAGAGSGKDSIRDIVEAYCDENYVRVSLDSNRDLSAHHLVQMAANHHGDDYRFVEPFANAIRTWVAEEARKGKYNVLYDGSGIDFRPRYEEIMREFSKSGFIVNLVAYDMPLEMAIPLVVKRAEKTGRALPWSIVVGKHVKAALSFMQAAESAAVDKASIFAKERSVGEHYLIAETFTIESKDIEKFKAAQIAGDLKELFANMILNRDDSILKLDAADRNAQTKIDKMPKFEESNVAYLTYPSEGKYKLLAVYDVQRFVAVIEKAKKNPSARTLAGLDSLPQNASFVTAA